MKNDMPLSVAVFCVSLIGLGVVWLLTGEVPKREPEKITVVVKNQ